MEMSYEEIRKALCDAFTAAFGSQGYIVDIWQDRCVIESNGILYEVPYSVDESGKVATGDMTRVRRQVQYVVMQTNTIDVSANQDATPQEYQVIPYGVHHTSKGVEILTEDDADIVTNNFETRKSDMVIDYEHQSLHEPPIESPAAGWIKKLINKGKDGIWATIEWTDRARQMIANKEYRYLSPVVMLRAADRHIIRLFNVGLTNMPNIDGMVPLINKLDIFEVNENTKEVSGMKALLKLLGLPEDATEEQAIAVVNTLKATNNANARVVANRVVLDALGLPENATEAEITGTIMAMQHGSNNVTELSKQVTLLTNKLNQRDADDSVAQAMQDGKITPAQKDWAMDYAKRDLEGFKVFVNKAPVVVIDGRIVTNQKAGEGALDDTQLMINKMCGVDDETFKKYGPKEN